MAYALIQIAEELNGVVVGDDNMLIHRIASLANAKEGEIAYVTEKNINALTTCNASAVIVPDINRDFPIPVIKVQNPRLAFIYLLKMFGYERTSNGTISSSTIDPSLEAGFGTQIDEGVIVKENVSIGAGTVIASHSFIGEHVTIGHHCWIHPNVTILRDTKIGDNVIIHSGAVIGADGFGYEWDGVQHVKIPHIGNVIIGDGVEIGANTTIDRGTIDSTVVGHGTKIDNLVQIGHNVQIGEHCIIAATSAIAGSSIIGNRVVMAGGCGIINHVSVGDQALLMARTGISKDVPARSIISGYWGRPHKEQLKEYAAVARLPKTLKEINRKLDILNKEPS
ncbi:UDP-3-O-(3-hydroxymyristoyl)glucosamine N-acyltransferase [Paenibacillus sp. JCM 10914]|uniref:UDP-3-O-(3-hydroxymyristoyl)glucosamine N-acyltransferase n=1 Tax=Paenibacillus sp. JCM 10914 TaxID=1236974 RepID=UPI0003CC5A4D|nr:UDP-3-O-(3-hydroxymyristoyl)glucosamine N-acyltransferase [Paenibacillus sp. JCM 10914]GAE07851.1 nitrite reductase [Paenibacillus sp. JCM 10914]